MGKCGDFKLPSSSLSFCKSTGFQCRKAAVISKVIQLIEKHQNFDPNLLKDISIGYQLEEVSQQPKTGEKTVEFNSNSVKLVPSWFYYYNSKWYRIAPPTEGGDNDGLE